MEPALAESIDQDPSDALFATESAESVNIMQTAMSDDLYLLNSVSSSADPGMNPGYVLLIFVLAVIVLFCAKVICSEDRSYLVTLRTKERSIATVDGSTYSETATTPKSQQMESKDVVFHISDRPETVHHEQCAEINSNREEETSDESEISEPVPTELSTIYE